MVGMCEHGTHRIPDCPSCGMVKSKCWADSDSNSTSTTNQPCDLEEASELHSASGSSSVKWVYINRPCFSRLMENPVGSGMSRA